METIDREDMLELTRRMTPERNCFGRIAGAYLDADGYVDGTFNRHFRRLSPADQKRTLKLARAVPFAKTNEELTAHRIGAQAQKPGSLWQLLMALKECELKNDALLDVFYEMFGEKYKASAEYAVYFFYGAYDVPSKASDKERLDDSEEVYSFLICTVSPVSGDYEAGAPVCGFLFPSFRKRSSDVSCVNLFAKRQQDREFLRSLFG